ncbi:MAG: hypothetical protein AAGG02_09145 [Cyanobacteria bacterium P01_H01_bin.15]
MFRLAILVSALILGGNIGLLSAQAQETESETEQERIEKGVREMGLLAGYAYQCHLRTGDEDAAETVGDESLAVAEIVLEDVGSTLAFLFAGNAGFGAGTTFESENCEQAIVEWNKFVDEFFADEEDESEEASSS